MELDEGEQAALDELWDGDFLLPDSPSLRLSAPAPIFGDAAGEEDALAPTAPRAFRCLDSGHAADCAVCSPPPADSSRWEIRGDPGKRNGEKRLRSLLTRTVEWRSSAERLRAASAVEASSSSLAAALRKRSASELSKSGMLRLLDLWGYKCNLWVPRGNRLLALGKRSAARASQDVVAQLPARLDPLLNEYARLMLGVETRQLAERSAAAREAFARELLRMERNNNMMKTVWEPFLRKFITHCRARGTPSESDTATCGHIARLALDTYTKFLAHYQAALAEPEVSAEARCWLDEIIEVNALMVKYFQHIADAFASCAAADAAAASRLASTVLPFYLQFVSVAIGANTARIDWVRELCAMDSAASRADDGLITAMAAVVLTPDIDKFAMAAPDLEPASSEGSAL